MGGESKFRTYGGKELFEIDFKKREWLIESILRENESVILVGSEKSGKSVFIKQLICSLTSQHPFLDRLEVTRPCRVSYIQLEGELSDTVDRLNRMTKALDLNNDLFYLHYSKPLEMQDPAMVGRLYDEIVRHHKPDVLIIDPIYFAFTGSLSNDEIVRQFIGNIRVLKDMLNCAVILVHHTHKTKYDFKGGVINENDEAIFGSKFLKAWADHILLFNYDKRSNTRVLSCDTQRSGDIIKSARLVLREPCPLYFEEIELDNVTKEASIINYLVGLRDTNGLTAIEISKAMGIPKSTFYASVKKLLHENIVVKTKDTRPVKYMLKQFKEQV